MLALKTSVNDSGFWSRDSPRFHAITCRAVTSRAYALLTKNIGMTNTDILLIVFFISVHGIWWIFKMGVWAVLLGLLEKSSYFTFLEKHLSFEGIQLTCTYWRQARCSDIANWHSEIVLKSGGRIASEKLSNHGSCSKHVVKKHSWDILRTNTLCNPWTYVTGWGML